MGASWSQLGSSWGSLGPNLAPLGSNLELLGSLWDSTWPFQLASKRNLDSTGPLQFASKYQTPLGPSNWRLSATWIPPQRLPLPSEFFPPALQVLFKCTPSVLQLEYPKGCHCQPSSRDAEQSTCASKAGRIQTTASDGTWPFKIAFQVNFNLHTHLTFELSFALPFELPQQLSVRTKLHLNFQNSYRFQQYTIASALHRRWTSTGAR